MHVACVVIDEQKESFRNEYDELFNKIYRSVKQSESHLKLLEEELVLFLKSEKFMADNEEYFTNKRNSLLDKLYREPRTVDYTDEDYLRSL